MKHFIWMVFILGVLAISHHWYIGAQMQRGRAISQFLLKNHRLVVPPEQARYLNPIVTTYDISIDNLEIFESTRK